MSGAEASIRAASYGAKDEFIKAWNYMKGVLKTSANATDEEVADKMRTLRFESAEFVIGLLMEDENGKGFSRQAVSADMFVWQVSLAMWRFIQKDSLQLPREKRTKLPVQFDELGIERFGKPSSPEHAMAISSARQKEEEEKRKAYLQENIDEILAKSTDAQKAAREEEQVVRTDAPQGQSSASAHDESTASRQMTRSSSSAARNDFEDSRWNLSRDAGRNDRQGDNQAVVSRKRARDDDDFLAEDTKGVKFARHGEQVLENSTGHSTDTIPDGNTMKGTKYWPGIPQSVGVVGGKFVPGTVDGEATWREAVQHALSASYSSSVIFLLAPVRTPQTSTPTDFMSGRPLNTLEATEKAEVPYRSETKAKASDKDDDISGGVVDSN